MWATRLFWKLALVYLALAATLTVVFLVVAAPDQLSPAGMQWGTGVFAAGQMMLALGFTYALVRQIAGPLARLTRGAQAITAGRDATPALVEGGDEVQVLGAAFDQMRIELARRLDDVRQNSERLVTVLGSMQEGVLAVDANERILLANDASRRLLEFVTADAVGRPLLEVTRSRAIHEAVAEALQTRTASQHEFEAPGSVRRVLSLRASCLPGQPCPGVVVVLHDVTDLRRLENLRRELVANVSHELKTPLASIKAYAETLRLGAVYDTEHNLAFVGRIEEQAERLHQLILDLLQLARIEAGEEAFEITDVALAGAAESCALQYAAAAAAKQIRLELCPASHAVAARADEEGLRTILDNLVDNAIKYTPEGGQVTIRWRAESESAALEVEDTGIGISPKDQTRVFERFYRVDKARSRELGGTGLGLSIVKHLAQAFGGSVGLESQKGKGSKFLIRLPLA